jgi:hypothetical protein
MNNFEIYIKTSALGKTGIHWRKVEGEDYQPVEVPNLIKRQVLEENGNIFIVNDLLDEIKPSLIIFRDNQENKLLLEVTGIESAHRSNKLGRKVLNSIVWIGDDNEENENILRKLAYSAIQNILQKDCSFSQMIEKSINFYEIEEFRANLKYINNFVDSLEAIQSQVYANNSYQIQNKSPECLDKLAEELRNYCLPKQWIGWDREQKSDGALVVVTESLEKRDILYKADVWRGFASRVEEPIREEAQLLKKKTEAISSVEAPKAEKPLYLPQSRQKISLMIILGVIIILLIILCVSLLLQAKHQLQPEQTPQPQVKQILKIQLQQIILTQK